MPVVVEVVEPDEFEAWLDSEREPPAAAEITGGAR
jgi:heme/copper-type cytochrome/quinol oxidase subunit 2